MRADDAAREFADSELERLERKIAREYAQASKEMREKQARWMKDFAAELEMREKALDDTEEALAAHKRWLQSKAAQGDW